MKDSTKKLILVGIGAAIAYTQLGPMGLVILGVALWVVTK